MSQPTGAQADPVHPLSSADGRLSRYEADVMKSARHNHIWVNAFATTRPSDDLALQVGRLEAASGYEPAFDAYNEGF